MNTAGLRFSLHPSIHELPPLQWDALGDGQVMLQHAFLSLFEAHACVGGETGWLPLHAALHEGEELVAAMPLYLKEHSRGEYVFDWAWADAYARHGLAYYPKALCAVPFTPVSGQRILARNDHYRQALLRALLEWCGEIGLSSLHLLFAGEADLAAGEALGLMRRTSVQFHWQSRGETDFEAFLGRFSHDKRKKIRQDRRHAREDGLRFEVREGGEISPVDWDFFYQCYAHTYAEHRALPYLNREFFMDLGARLPQHCVLVLALRSEQPVAASLMLRDEQALYGRYWGALEYHPCLHFECCYYQGIEYAIRAGLQRFEGGAQGEHKLARGLEPVPTYSLHWLADPRFSRAVADYLENETGGVEHYLDELRERMPFRREDA